MKKQKYKIINLKYKYKYTYEEQDLIEQYLNDVIEQQNYIKKLVGNIDDIISINNNDDYQLEFSYKIVLNK